MESYQSNTREDGKLDSRLRYHAPWCDTKGLTRWELLALLTAVSLLVSLLVPALARAKHRAQRIGCISHLKQIGIAYRIWDNDHQQKFPWQLHQRAGGTVPDEGEIGRNFGELVEAFRSISNELTVAIVLSCPGDPVRTPARDFHPQAPRPFGGKPPKVETRNLSYLVGWEADGKTPATLLVGDGFLGGTLPNGSGDAGRSGVVREVRSRSQSPDQPLTPLAGFTNGWHADGANVGLADGSAHQINEASWREFLGASVAHTTNFEYRLVMPKW